MPCSVRPPRDHELIQIVDAALADTKKKSGAWLKCGPGCTQCCVGVFAINQLDAVRLRQGMIDFAARAPERAAAVRQRAQEYVQRVAKDFPGDPETGLLYEDEESQKRFEDFANDEPCPALDPVTGYCEVYESRPVMCRTFGPPLREGADLGVCELCYDGATEAEIEACEMVPDPKNLEPELIKEAEKSSGRTGETIVAYCLLP
jgi:Fe-S-cluster containining protein